MLPIFSSQSESDCLELRQSLTIGQPLLNLMNYLTYKEAVYYLRVRDCCECFVYKYTHALTVQ